MENGRTFHVPRSLDITLENAQVSHLDVVHLKYFTEFQWLLDFSIYASATYFLTEVMTIYTEQLNILKVADKIQ